MGPRPLSIQPNVRTTSYYILFPFIDIDVVNIAHGDGKNQTRNNQIISYW